MPSTATTPLDRFHRWGPYGLLGLATLIAALSGDLLMTGGERIAAGPLVVTALALHLSWNRSAAERGGVSVAYYVVRYALGFALTWLNPFFAIYAMFGYFDADRLLPRRAVPGALLATAVTMAGSHIGGLPPADAASWAGFGVLFVINASFALIFYRFAAEETENARTKAATIERLEQALQENAGLHDQLVLQAREAGINDERRRLAAEIHDTLAQGLAGIITQLQAAADSADLTVVRDHIGRASALARHNLTEARRSVQDLGPGALEHDALPKALMKIVEAWSVSTGTRAEFAATGTMEPLHAEIEATLLRIVQEALANVDRHAAATRVGVTLSYMDDEVSLDVRDDGRGFDPRVPSPRDSRGFGLGGMRARAERIAGTLAVESETGYGTAVSARVPLVRHG